MFTKSYAHRNDKVKLMVIYIHDTTHFSARIIEHIPQSRESKKIVYSNVEYMQTTAKIQNYYQNIANRYVLSIFTIFLAFFNYLLLHSLNFYDIFC